MPKILVADDNSNVQKTVALALTGLGVDVVSVNNGDAAIRKLADIAPDLVLADIFMPVRNGYEVCEYVKKDTRFSHVPVVLLVGAFDPLDEREAQRVGADGILKKPFVPPDPLITMVKALLSRNTVGDNLVAAVAAAKPAAAAQEKSGGVATIAPPRPAPPEPVEELPEEIFMPAPDRVSFGEGEHPVAFGQLLDAPTKDEVEPEVMEPVDDATVLTSSRDASLGEPIFWKTEEPEAETGEENGESEEETSRELPAREWKADEEAKHSPEMEAVEPEDAVAPLELVRDQDEIEEGLSAATVASSASILQDAASQASLTVQAGKAPELAANPIEWMATAPPQHMEETEEETHAGETQEGIHAEEMQEEAAEWNPAAVASGGDSHEEDASHLDLAPAAPWVAETEPVTPVTPVAPAAPSAMQSAISPREIAAEIPEPHKTQPSLKTLAQTAEETARSIPKQDWADLAASLQAKPADPAAEKSKATAGADAKPATVAAASSSTVSAGGPASASPDPALVEAVVQRILDKMRPQVVDIITKEFLRPIVQALVHREIEKG